MSMIERATRSAIGLVLGMLLAARATAAPAALTGQVSSKEEGAMEGVVVSSR